MVLLVSLPPNFFEFANFYLFLFLFLIPRTVSPSSHSDGYLIPSEIASLSYSSTPTQGTADCSASRCNNIQEAFLQLKTELENPVPDGKSRWKQIIRILFSLSGRYYCSKLNLFESLSVFCQFLCVDQISKQQNVP